MRELEEPYFEGDVFLSPVSTLRAGYPLLLGAECVVVHCGTV